MFIISDRNGEMIDAQVVGFRQNVVLLMALNSVHLIHPGCKVISKKIQILFLLDQSFWGGLLMAWVDLLMGRGL